MFFLKSKNNKNPVFLNRFLNRFLLFTALTSAPVIGQGASLAWDSEQFSEAITTGSPRTEQHFVLPEEIRAQASTLGKVQISYRHAGRAVLKSRLCLQGGPCVDMNGAALSTKAFEGQDARRGFVLHHEVWSWAGSTVPVRVHTSIRVNYQH